MTEQAKTIDEIRKLSVEKLEAELPALDSEQLAALKAAELAEGEGKTRSTAIKAIDEALEKLAAPAPAGEGDQGDSSGEGEYGDGSGEGTGGSDGSGETGSDGAEGSGEGDGQAHPQPSAASALSPGQSGAEPHSQSGGEEGPDDEEDAGVNDAGPRLVFIANGEPIAGLPEVPVDLRRDFAPRGERGLLRRSVEVSPHGPSCTITAVRLVTPGGDKECAIPGGLAAGGGRSARFPAESLIF